jgi:hypothetical protein
VKYLAFHLFALFDSGLDKKLIKKIIRAVAGPILWEGWFVVFVSLILTYTHPVIVKTSISAVIYVKGSCTDRSY